MARTLDKLEQTVLDLGVELFRLKSDMAQIKNGHDRFVKVLAGLRAILDEKGIISADDFETAVDLNEIMNQQRHSQAQEEAGETVKKASH